MWSLIDIKGKEIILKQDEITTVGRRNANIILDNDNSISKLHAKITVVKSEEPNRQYDLECTIIDAESKYGSFIIGPDNKIETITTAGRRCKHMEKVRFGLQQYVFTLKYTSSYRYMSLISRIDEREREELSRVLGTINGVLSLEWNPQCTHVTCSTVLLTEKVVCALVTGLHIVTKEYWYALVDALGNQRKQTLPNPADFTPKVDSRMLVTEKMSLLPNPSRKFLFKNKIFIFFSEEQFKLYSRMIKLGGGSSIIYHETWKPKDCCEPNNIVVQLMDLSQSTQSLIQQFRSVCLRISQEKLRSIPESDIPLAILYCSMEQYCNPRYRYDILLQPSERDSMIETAGDILAMETQPQSKSIKNNQRKQIVPESVPIDTQISSQMNCQMSLETRKQTGSTAAKPKIIRSNVIIPETASMDTQTSARTQSQTSSNTDKQKNSTVSEKQPSEYGKKNVGKPRVTEMEIVIPPLFPTAPTRNRQSSDENRCEMSEPQDPNDELIDDDDDDDDDDSGSKPSKKQPYRANKPTSKNTVKKRLMEIDPPVLSDSDEPIINKSLRKRRKLSHDDNSNVIQPPDIETVEPASIKNTAVENGKNSASSTAGPSRIGINVAVEQLSHYFSRNRVDKPKCIIPKRLTIEDMYEWKPNRQL